MSNAPSVARLGLLAEFADAGELKLAAAALQDYQPFLDAFSPFPVDGLAELCHRKASPLPWIIAIGGLIGGVSMYAFQYWVSVSAYPLNIGGRPLHSWPAFIPPTFELTILMAALFGLGGVIYVCGLPRLHHPLFEVEAFKRASSTGFFLALTQLPSASEMESLHRRLQDLGAVQVWEVPDG